MVMAGVCELTVKRYLVQVSDHVYRHLIVQRLRVSKDMKLHAALHDACESCLV